MQALRKGKAGIMKGEQEQIKAEEQFPAVGFLGKCQKFLTS